jgi:DNA-directed RNA polymerase specialized sigma24 family protein
MTGVALSAEGRSAEPKRTLPADERRRAALTLVEGHDAAFRRTARRYSLCAADAEDAYQRALEIVLTKAPAITGERLVRWMQTVTKHEALAVRRQRERMLTASRIRSNPSSQTAGSQGTSLSEWSVSFEVAKPWRH